jgi:hypothetical protein
LHDGHTQDIIRFARTKYNLRGKKIILELQEYKLHAG